MNVEILEFYPIERNEERDLLTGTLRVKLPDIGIHILGIYVSKRKDYWNFSLPYRSGIDHKTGEKIKYPIIVFEDREQHRSLIEAIRKKGLVFIERRLSDKENPLIFPQEQQSSLNRHPPTKTQDSAAEGKEKRDYHISKPSIPLSGWVDPPPRKTALNKGAFRRCL